MKILQSVGIQSFDLTFVRFSLRLRFPKHPIKLPGRLFTIIDILQVFKILNPTFLPVRCFFLQLLLKVGINAIHSVNLFVVFADTAQKDVVFGLKL